MFLFSQLHHRMLPVVSTATFQGSDTASTTIPLEAIQSHGTGHVVSGKKPQLVLKSLNQQT